MPVPEVLFRNPSRKAIRLLLILAAIFLAIGLPPVFFIGHFSAMKGQDMSNFQLAGLLAMAIGLPVGAAMLLSALLTIPTARQTDRHFNDFLSGHLLAEWTYSTEQWSAFVTAEARRWRRGKWIYFAFFMIPSLLTGAFIAIMASSTTNTRLLHCGYVLAAAVAVSIPYFFLAGIYLRRHHAQLLKYPKAYIGRNAVYCGGDFNFWGSGMRGLDSMRIIPGNPPMLEVIVGLSQRAAQAMKAVDAINIATLHPTYASGMKARQAIPIPTGCEAQAEEIVRMLTPPVPRPAVVHPPVVHPPVIHAQAAALAPAFHPAPVKLTAAPVPSTSSSPTADFLHHRTHRWWRITAALFVLGLTCFILIIPLDSHRPAGQDISGATTAMALFALLFWMLSLGSLIYAIILTIKARSATKSSGLTLPAQRS
jgi:hypothetical protein